MFEREDIKRQTDRFQCQTEGAAKLRKKLSPLLFGRKRWQSLNLNFLPT